MDSDTPHHPTGRRVIRKQGNAGFGALVRLWCFAAQYGKAEPGRCVDSDGDAIPVEDLLDACGLEENEFEELIEVLVDAKCIDARAWSELGELSFPGMTTRADEYTKKVRRNNVRTSSRQNLPTVQDSTKQNSTEEGKPLLEVFGDTTLRMISKQPERTFAREKVQGIESWRNTSLRMMESWNILTDKPIPRCRGLSKKREGLIKRLIVSSGLSVEIIFDGFKKINASKFCRGENERGWVATFDWALLPDSILKATEGKYDNRSTPVKAGQTRSQSGKYDEIERK
tara:strand:- start:22618 stop:23472 length:855 start_codon:yes stop_codon:yes gene_type:complete